MWMLVAVLLGTAPVDVQKLATVSGPYMQENTCYQDAAKMVDKVDREKESWKGKKVRFGCIYIKPDKRIVM